MTRLGTAFVVVIVTLAIALMGAVASADTLIDVSDLPFEYSFPLPSMLIWTWAVCSSSIYASLVNWLP